MTHQILPGDISIVRAEWALLSLTAAERGAGGWWAEALVLSMVRSTISFKRLPEETLSKHWIET